MDICIYGVCPTTSIYSPTSFGVVFGVHPLKCTEILPGAPIYYASGPCRISGPYNVGHPFEGNVYMSGTSTLELIEVEFNMTLTKTRPVAWHLNVSLSDHCR